MTEADDEEERLAANTAKRLGRLPVMLIRSGPMPPTADSPDAGEVLAEIELCESGDGIGSVVRSGVAKHYRVYGFNGRCVLQGSAGVDCDLKLNVSTLVAGDQIQLDKTTKIGFSDV